MRETLEPEVTSTPGTPDVNALAVALATLPDDLRTRLMREMADTPTTTGSAAREIMLPLAASEVKTLVAALHDHDDLHFADLFAEVDPTPDAPNAATRLRLHLVVAMERQHLWLHAYAPLDAESPHLESLVNTLPAADWYERELWDEAGIVSVDHPGLRRLRLPARWPYDARPLLGGLGNRLLEAETQGGEEEADAHIPLLGSDDEREALDPGPEGVVDYPLGPVRSGVVESGHYTLRTVGEEIVDFRLQLFYKHRGVEQRALGLTPLHLPLVAERISGTSGFGHALAVCEALERAAGVSAPPRARFLRTLFAELERLYNHFGYQADLCQATGLVVGQAQYDILKERVLRLNAQITGHRYLFGACVYGGVACDPAPMALAAIGALIGALRSKARRLGKMILESPSHVDRLENTGILPTDDARKWAVVGPNGRASGANRDVRRDHPYAAYGEVAFEVPVFTTGDALARARVRLEEIVQSVRIIEQVLEQLPSGPTRLAALEAPVDVAALGWVESPRGEGLHWLRMDATGAVARYRVRTASFANAQAFPLCIPGRNILTDFPVIEQSWALSYAGADR